MRNNFDLRIALGSAILLCATAAGADDTRYNNILIGDRAAGMGGAYTAVSDDPSGMFYNPAGIVYSSGSNINGSMNAFHRTQTRYKNVLDGRDWTRESQILTPNFVGYTQPFAGGTLGLSWAVIDAVLEDQEQDFQSLTVAGVGVDRYIININNQDTTYNLGPSFAYKLRENLSIGLTLYGHYRTAEQVWNEQIYFSGGSRAWKNVYLEKTEYGIKPVLGAMWSPMERLSVGLSVRKGWLLSADAKRQYTLKTAATATVPEPEQQTSDFKRDLPLQVNAGAALFANERWLISGDFSYVSAVDDLRWITNFALGSEYYVTSKWAVRVGVFSNVSATPEVEAGQEGQDEHVDLYGFSASLTHFTHNSAVTFGFAYSQGTGEAQVLDDQPDIQDVEYSSVTAYLSGTHSY